MTLPNNIILTNILESIRSLIALKTLFILFCIFLTYACSNKEAKGFNMEDLYPWCIVAFDSLERSPAERIDLLKELGFVKYAYDWRDKNLDEMESELLLAQKNNIEIISVWLWLNAKRDSIEDLSPSNNRVFEILKKTNIRTTVWVSFSHNFFDGRTQEESLILAKNMIKHIYLKAQEIDCKIALYNHRGWFGNPYNQIEIIKTLPEYNLRMVYNFHHAHEYIKELPQIFKEIQPYLSAVNLNGMQVEGPKILPIGAGDLEANMIKMLQNEGYEGPWGILGHVENADVKKVLERNIEGLNSLGI